MPADFLSRYRNLEVMGVTHQAHGRTLSLPIRRDDASWASAAGGRVHRLTGYESHDLLSLRFYGREDLYWVLLDSNGRRLPDEFEAGELINVPPADEATRVNRNSR